VSPEADLPDLNVWLALASSQHIHHRQALHYREQLAAEQVLFCTVTALGLVRLVSQPRLMGDAVKNAAEASELLAAFCRQPGVALAPAEHDGWDVFHHLMRQGNLPPRLCTDAHLAALAMANGWRLVSFDRDFERFEGLHWLALS
jgi:toxin-antitoxin system PIN domain toxin